MISIAIDGTSGAGKSSISDFIADTLSFVHVDTGSLYRAVGFYVLSNGVDPYDSRAVVSMLDSLDIQVEYDGDRQQHVFVNGKEVRDELTTNDVSMAASVTSAIPEVRDFLLDLQRSIAQRENIVMNGRDVGTVVLPDADIKFYITAAPEVRAQRRLKDYLEKNIDITYEKVLEDIIQRDINDMTREIAPLMKADDAIEIDNSDMTEDEVHEHILSIIKGKIG